MKQLRTAQGQALVEVMVAVGILAVGFLGVISLLSRAFALNRIAADNYVGTYLAAEGIEVTKNIIDSTLLNGSGWMTGITAGDHEVDPTVPGLIDCLAPCEPRALSYDQVTHLYTYSIGTPTTFRRRITISVPPAGQGNEVDVTSQVTWLARGGGTSQVTLEDHFYNWR